MPYAQYTPTEVREAGEEIYRRQLQEQLEPAENGRFLVIDIESGEFEVDDTDLAATKRMLQRRPDAVLYGMRIGDGAAYRLGGQKTVSKR